ncbi:hypothetical protein BSPWISOXPB_6155 [uncultured Gammaproteobacteria bacterium]|nr:hypothetical protein BSPWISOXPB_6155 [uncultured Gammaproteobacteria bacterium]
MVTGKTNIREKSGQKIRAIIMAKAVGKSAVKKGANPKKGKKITVDKTGKIVKIDK